MKKIHYGWIMVIVSICLMIVQALRIFTFGIFLRPLADEFHWGRGQISTAYAICMFMSGSFSLLAGKISDKYGPRIIVTASGLLVALGFFLLSRISTIWQLYLVWAVFMGLGGAFFFIPIFTTIPRWFIKNRGTAVALTSAGFGIGGIISPPLAQMLISNFGWQIAYIVLSIITLVIVIPLAQLLKQSPQRIGIRAYGDTASDNLLVAKDYSLNREFSFREVLKNRYFWILGFLQFCFFACLQVILVHINPYAVDVGIPELTAAGIVSFISMFSTLGRISTGFLSDRFGGKLMLIACLVTTVVSLVWLLFTRDIWMFYVFALIFGLAYGGMVPLSALVPAELFGMKAFGMIYAGIMVISTIGESFGAPLAGFIFDYTGSYSPAFIICIVISLIATFLSFLILKSGNI